MFSLDPPPRTLNAMINDAYVRKCDFNEPLLLIISLDMNKTSRFLVVDKYLHGSDGWSPVHCSYVTRYDCVSLGSQQHVASLQPGTTTPLPAL